MQLVADRFVVSDDGRALDLADGAHVTVIVGRAGGVSEQLRWIQRCEAFRSLHHHAMAPLVDFGLVGECSRFEAWGCGPQWNGAGVEQFLRGCGLSGTGYPLEADGDVAENLPLAARGLQLIDRRALPALSEMFHTAGSARPYASALWGPEGSGKRIVVRELARIARIAGFVPIASRLIASRHEALWRGRSLFVIADAAREGVWSAFLDAALRASQPHVLLVVGVDECRSMDGVALGRVSADALVSAVRPQAVSGAIDRAIRRAADRAQGLPGRFMRLLWPDSNLRGAAPSPASRGSLPRVAEQPAVYGGEEEAEDRVAASPLPSAWPAPGELAALRRKLDGALAHLAHGRHAPGIRQLRQSIGGLARRGAWTDAGDGALALVGALLRRGRARDAQAAIDEGREYAIRAGREPMLVDLAILGGEIWIDLGRLDEADSVLGAALVAARAGKDPTQLAAVSITLARCSYWRGRYADAEVALGRAADALPSAIRVRHALLASRIAVGQGDLNRAMSLAAEVRQRTLTEDEAGSKAAAASAMAFVHLAVGDLGAAERDAADAIVAAQGAHDPLRVARARLLRAEVDRRGGRSASALAQLQKLRRVMATAPPLLRARWEVATALCSGAGDPRDAIARHVGATGLGALALYVAAPGATAGAPDVFVDEVVAILRVCQTAEDEAVVLKDVCTRVRHHLHATAAAFVSIRGARAQVVAAAGARLETDIAQRAASAAIVIAPHRRDDRIEAAAPVQYGGVPIGALCARWTLGSTYDTSHAASVLAMSAAAAAPMLAAAMAAQERSSAGASELLGITPAMGELRANVERAAAAPFPVLIDGESGSGKELVARAIHRGGPRRPKPFCTLNCAALPDDLVEAELFGHARGSFTGAVADRAGVFEEAHGGTLFLDEIGELSLRAQAKVLRVIQEGELRRVGENVSRRVDVRVVSATNRQLRREADEGRFRLDLLYRLDVVHITVPPLRDRREDIAVLAEHFWRDAAIRVGSRATLGAATIAALARYNWPGNVRELQNVLAALAVRSPKRGVVPPSALPAVFAESATGAAWRLDEARRTFEERFVRAALVRTGGHRGRAATELGVTRQGLTKLLTRLGISP